MSKHAFGEHHTFLNNPEPPTLYKQIQQTTMTLSHNNQHREQFVLSYKGIAPLINSYCFVNYPVTIFQNFTLGVHSELIKTEDPKCDNILQIII